jgi:hypothetical protein
MTTTISPASVSWRSSRAERAVRTRALALPPLALLALAVVPGARLEAQATFAIDAGAGWGFHDVDGSPAVTGALEVNRPGRLGARLGVTHAASRAFVTAEARVDLETGLSVFVPYVVGGAGTALDDGEANLLLTAGGGLRTRLNPRLDLFAEARLFAVPGDHERERVVPLTAGVRIRLGAAAR